MRKRTLTLLLLAAVTNILSSCGVPPGTQNTSSVPNVASPGPNSDGATIAAAGKCKKADDEAIKEQIRESIDSDPDLVLHRRHINFSTKVCRVTLRGWVDTFPKFRKLYYIVSNAGGVRSVDISGFELRPPGTTPTPTPMLTTLQCPSPLKKCVELCIPEDEDCTIPSETIGVAGTPTPTSTSTPTRTP